MSSYGITLGTSLFIAGMVLAGAPADSLLVEPLQPPDGTWFASGSVPIDGTASQPSVAVRTFGGAADFQGGTHNGTTVEPGGGVQPVGSSIGQVQFLYNFSGAEGSVPWQEEIEWSAVMSGGDCNITSAGASLLPGAPALACRATGATLSLHVTAPRPIESATVTMRAAAEAGARWRIDAFPDGDPVDFRPALPTLTGVGPTSANVSLDLSGLLFGKQGAYILLRAESTTGATSNRAFLDDVAVAFQLQPPSGSNTYHYIDTFSGTNNTTLALTPAWTSNGTGWGWGGPGNSTGNNTLRHSGAFSFIFLHVVSAVNITDARLDFQWRCVDTPGLSDDLGMIATYSHGTAMPDFFQHEEGSLWAGNNSVWLVNYLGGPELVLKVYSQGECMVDNLDLALTLDDAIPVPTSGVYTSTPIDFGGAVSWGRAYFDVVSPPGSGAVFDIRASGDGSSWSAWARTATGDVPVVPWGRYLQLRASLWGDDLYGRPNLTSVRIESSGITSVRASIDGGTTWQELAIAPNPDPANVRWNGTIQLAGGYNTVLIRASDSGGTVSDATRQINWDVFPPSAPPAPLGPLATNSSTIAWRWDAATDEGLGVAEYRVRVGSAPGAADLVDNVSVGLDTSFNISGASHGVVYYASVQARDGAGLWGPWSASSQPVYADMEPPEPAVPSAAAWGNSTAISWTWPTPNDNTTMVDAFLVWVGTQAGGSDIAGIQRVQANEFEITGAVEGPSYFLSIRALDIAGNMAPPATSGAVRVDRTPPGDFAVLSEPDAFVNTTELSWAWGLPDDLLSGLAWYEVEIGSAPGAHDLLSISSGLEQVTTLAGVPSGTFVSFRVRACDAVGNCGAWVDGRAVGVDRTPPAAPTITTGPPSWTNHPVLNWSWTAPADDLSGVGGFLVALGSTPGGADIVPFFLSLAPTASFPGGSEGNAYYLTVRAVDRAGNAGAAVSSGLVRVDLTPPSSVAGILPTNATSSTARATFSWSSVADESGSGPGGWAVEVTGGSDSGTHFTGPGASSIEVNGSDGESVSVRVRAIDQAGNQGKWSLPGVVVFDLSPPQVHGEISVSVVGAGGFSEWDTDHDVLVGWPSFTDNSTRVVSYVIRVGTQPGAADILEQEVTELLPLTFRGRGGTTYYISLDATDEAGNAISIDGPSGGTRVPDFVEGALPMIALIAVGSAVGVAVFVAWTRSRGRSGG